jgi:hypothetical protein
MAKKGQIAVEMIELQTTVRALEVEVLGRYVSQPKHLDRIRLVLADAFDQLGVLGQDKGVAALGCPAGYVHMAMCTCKPVSAAVEAQETPGLRQRELKKLAKRAR